MSRAYYNEIDSFAAQWLRNLIAAGHIAPGEVDERSIKEVQPEDLRGFDQVHLFAGIGVWSYALRRAGWPDDRPVWTGSCPCQPFASPSRGQRKSFEDARHLWPEMFRLLTFYRPRIVFGEQVATGAGMAWLDRTTADLYAEQYTVGAVRACASTIYHPRRDRFFFAAYTYCEGQCSSPFYAKMAGVSKAPRMAASDRQVTCRMGTQVDGSSARVGRLRAYGNAIVATLAAEFIQAATEAIHEV